MTYITRDTGQNIGGVLAAMQEGKGVTRGFTGTLGYHQRAYEAMKKARGLLPDLELDGLKRMIEKVSDAG